ncbi:MAG: helicase [Planctomycetes bacterium]|nr:helicase [Planctomycetota bacterium]
MASYDLEAYRRGHLGPGGTDLRGRRIVVFDLETRRAIGAGSDRAEIAELGMSVGVTFSYRDGLYRTYGENEAEDLVAELIAASGVIGYNVIGFDYPVLAGEVPGFDARALRTLDLMVELQKAVGFRPRLNHLLAATFHAAKSGNGLEAIALYRDMQWDKLVSYCLDDVALTRALFEYGRETGTVALEVEGAVRTVSVDWKAFPGDKGLFD